MKTSKCFSDSFTRLTPPFLTSSANPETDCSANSFMIGDGVCDEVTNTERCLYDGGDCCLEDKQTHLCRKCTCLMDIEESKVMKEMDELGAELYDPDQIIDTNKLLVVVKHVDEVASKLTCFAFCLDAIKKGIMEIDSLMYFHKPGASKCSCTSFQDCFNPSTFLSLEMLIKNEVTDIVGLTGKLLPCRKFTFSNSSQTDQERFFLFRTLFPI